MLIRGMLRLNLLPLALDLAHLGSASSTQSHVCLTSVLSLLDKVSLGMSVTSRSLTRFGSLATLFGRATSKRAATRALRL